MARHSRVALALLAVVFALWAVRAHAQQAISLKDAAEAKRHFDVGLRLFNEHATAQALVEFQQAYTLGNRASALRNIAQCQRDLQQFTEAYKSYALLKDKHSKDLTTADLEYPLHEDASLSARSHERTLRV